MKTDDDSCPSAAPAGARAGKPFCADDLYAHHDLSELDGCPAQELIACTVQTLSHTDDTTVRKLWCVPLDGTAPWPLTTGESSDSGARWSPDGQRLAFVSSRAGRNQVFVIRRDGGEATQLGQIDGTVSSVCWSPDGKRLAVLCTLEVDPDLRGSRPGPEDGPRPEHGPQVVWKLPYKMDGTGYTLDQESHLFVLDADGGESR